MEWYLIVHMASYFDVVSDYIQYSLNALLVIFAIGMNVS